MGQKGNSLDKFTLKNILKDILFLFSVKPRILNTGSSSLQDGFKGQIEISAKLSDDVVLPCEVKSVPPPFITWAKETQLISPFSQR